MARPDNPPRFRTTEEGDARFALELPSDLKTIEAAVSYLEARCRQWSFQGPCLELNFRVGVTEALANAVLYGNGSDPRKTVRVEVQLQPRRVEVHVIDQGSGFNPDSVPDPTAPENLERPGGRGLFLIRHLMDEMEYNARGNALRMVLFQEGCRDSRPNQSGRAP
jgi:serine/threonine-protein kinase RsbW